MNVNIRRRNIGYQIKHPFWRKLRIRRSRNRNKKEIRCNLKSILIRRLRILSKLGLGMQWLFLSLSSIVLKAKCERGLFVKEWFYFINNFIKFLLRVWNLYKINLTNNSQKAYKMHTDNYLLNLLHIIN